MIEAQKYSRVNHLELSSDVIKEEDIPKIYEEASAVNIDIDQIKI